MAIIREPSKLNLGFNRQFEVNSLGYPGMSLSSFPPAALSAQTSYELTALKTKTRCNISLTSLCHTSVHYRDSKDDTNMRSHFNPTSVKNKSLTLPQHAGMSTLLNNMLHFNLLNNKLGLYVLSSLCVKGHHAHLLCPVVSLVGQNKVYLCPSLSVNS